MHDDSCVNLRIFPISEDHISMTPEEKTKWDDEVAGWLSRFRPATVIAYTRWVDTFVKWCDENNVSPWEANRLTMDLFLLDLKDRKLKPATRALAYDSIKSLYTWLVADRIIDRNPFGRIRRPEIRREEQRRTWLTPMKYGKFLDTARRMGPDEYAVAVLGGMMSLRSGEMCSLDVESIVDYGGRKLIQYRRKGGKLGLTPIPIPANEAVLGLAALRESGPLIRTQAGNRMTTRSMCRIVERICRQAKIDVVTPHGLRRTFATVGLAVGIPKEDVMVAGGWEREDTLDLYNMGLTYLDTHATHRVAGVLGSFAN